MNATMEASGRVMLPAALRRAMMLCRGDRFLVRQEGDHIELVPDIPELEMEIAEDGLPILVGEGADARILNDEVAANIHAAREERGDELAGRIR